MRAGATLLHRVAFTRRAGSISLGGGGRRAISLGWLMPESQQPMATTLRPELLAITRMSHRRAPHRARLPPRAPYIYQLDGRERPRRTVLHWRWSSSAGVTFECCDAIDAIELFLSGAVLTAPILNSFGTRSCGKLVGRRRGLGCSNSLFLSLRV
ncbi:hypothetical protein PHYPSEUDO_009354 [Phytophthora pseudosyringae]|uniref:Uncharacterized protein n=1 Tax=Phytophthora pseudosyringae TaxID=221518 RepID=A0A8T1W996_9STRA|nr:hypothetical protein PHYPSEUDO_009354 [Phytophthora pseudosyringae]